jgi:hypothetical protein
MLRKEEYARGMVQRSKSNHATMKDVQTMLKKEECAFNMGQRSNNAAVRDAQISLKKEECVLDTGQRSNYVAVKDAQIMLGTEECAGGMGQSGQKRNAAEKGVQILSSKEEYASGMVQRLVQSANHAAVKDVQTKSNVGECVEGTGLTAVHKTNLQHLDQSSR